jgi:uncharacterized membrane-anchored protein
MNKKTIFACLALVIAFQIAVLAAEYLGAAYPLWTGEEIRLKTVPVDPRSLFMGNYARLRYEISSVELKEPGEKKGMRQGEFVYVKLKPGPKGLFVFDGVRFEPPGSGPFIRGRLQAPRWRESGAKYDVVYGIEAYFASGKKALALEKELRNGGVATIMVSRSGKAALKDVTAEEK